MVQPGDIIDFTDRIAARFRPERIILFGSYAYGTPTKDSDVDLLVVMPHREQPYHKAAEISTAVPHDFPCDLMVRSAATLRERIGLNDFFLIEISEKGIPLYDAADARVGEKGRRRLRRRAKALARPQEAEL